jgi:tRNA(fMet)-specific endonuclease VapC
MKYLVDSDWLIDALAAIPAAVEPLNQLSTAGLAVSILSFGEVFEGAYLFPDPSLHLATFRQFLSRFTVLPITEDIMELFARHRSQLRQQGSLIPDLDLLIATTALSFNLTLMTRNLRHFTRIPDLSLYQPAPPSH